MRLSAALLVAVSASSCAALPARAAETPHADDWFAVYVNETKSGQAHTEVVRVEDESATPSLRWITTTKTELSLSRAGAKVQLHLSSRLEEDAEGRVIRYRQVQKLSDREIVTEGTVDGDTIRVVQNGVPGEVAYPAGALGPAATDRLVKAAGFLPETSTAVLGFTVDHPAKGANLAFTVVGAESVRLMDTPLRLHRVSVENSTSAARTMFMWFDAAGRMHASESDVPGLGKLRMVKTTEQIARSVSRPAEVFSGSLIAPDRGIPSPRRTKHAVFRLSRDDDEAFDARIYEGEGQVSEPALDGASVDVTIDVWEPPEDFAAFQRPVRDLGLARYLSKAAYLETDDEHVREHARAAVGDEKDALACARLIERYVRKFVSDKSMDVGFATAAEVARSGEGDCSEHAMLCAAVARASGLPSRVVMGLVYVPGMSAEGVGPRGAFGYHMWAEVLVAKDRWYPVDAAIGGFDATHIAMGKSDLATTSPMSQMVLPLLEAISSVQIEVVEVR